MAWADTNVRIRQCLASADPIACLTQLFENTRDGHVAMALGDSHNALGHVAEARRWYEEAERRYPLEDYKRRARRARDSLGSIASTAPEPLRSGQSTDTLHVVSCSRQKAWDNPGLRPERFLPAMQAYKGSEITAWLRDPASRTARWVILSAKYGFIEPDHPIADYDVTFNDPATGPITADALRAQVEHQTRWPEKIPLRGFSRVVVHGSASYVTICRQAFESIASVSKDGTGREQQSELQRVPSDVSLTIDDGRAAAVAAALATVADEVFEAFDRREPEWPVLERLSTWSHPRGLLAAMALALTDYQLGTGGANMYWKEIVGLLPDRQELKSAAELLKFFESLVARPVSARMADQKLARIKRLLTSAVVEKVKGASMQALGQDPIPLWHALATSRRKIDTLSL